MRIAASVASGLFIILLFWAGGYDFDERGLKAVALLLLVAYASCFVYVFYGLIAKDSTNE